GAVSIQDIAKTLEVKSPKIAYPFSSKEMLLEVIAEEMWTKMEMERKKRRDFPSFENLQHEITMYTQFQKEYAFIFNDLHVIKHPILDDRFRQFCLATIKDHEAAIAFAIKLGNMNPEPFAGAYHNLCLTLWILSMFWLPQQAIRKIQDETEVARVTWSLILPHFTPKGIESFKAFYGEEFYKNIGQPFKAEIDVF
ncbi:MAG: TetR/AcrR family transcriptional regulator, partial [Bacteroidota bacterium]